MSNADGAGVVLGARVPIILTSRADNRRTKLASCAVAVLMASAAAAQGRSRQEAEMEKVILVLNAGSSSLKFSLFAVPAAGEMRAVAVGQIEGLGTAPRLKVKDGAGERIADEQWDKSEVSGHAQALQRIAGCCARASRAACWLVSVTAWCMAARIMRPRCW
jgi:hypothetical protein